MFENLTTKDYVVIGLKTVLVGAAGFLMEALSLNHQHKAVEAAVRKDLEEAEDNGEQPKTK